MLRAVFGHLLAEKGRSVMKNSFWQKIVVPAFILSNILLLDYNHLFAGSNPPGQGIAQFGASEKPVHKSGEKAAAFRSVFADIAEKVVPAVVSVIPTKIDTIVFHNNPFYNFFSDPFSGATPFEFFFGSPERRPPGSRAQPEIRKQERRQQGIGSGVVVSKNGYILTNYHVVSGADEIEVKINDGRQFKAEIIGSDSLADVAVVKIKEKVSDLAVAYVGDSDKLRPGDWTIAIGNPFSLTSSVTVGIVSALNRRVSGGDAYQSFIQTDAAINPGNSGGALVNLDGELIGINTMIYTKSGGYMGIGFAIPINMAKRIMEDLIHYGSVERGWIGVSIQDIDPATREAMELGEARGVLVSDVHQNQPADKAGIKRGDIITEVDGKNIIETNQLRIVIASLRPGSLVPFTVIRNGKQIKLKLRVGSRDPRRNADSVQSEKSVDSQKSGNGRLGVGVTDLTAEIRAKYNIDQKIKGVLVNRIDSDIVNSSLNLRQGDVIREVKTKGKEFVSIGDVKEFERLTRNVKANESIMFLVHRKDSSFFVGLKIKE